MAKQITSENLMQSGDYASAIALDVVALAKSEGAAEAAGAMLTAHLREAFLFADNDAVAFVGLFGNGKAPNAKDFQAGSIALAVRAKLAKLPAEQQTRAKDILKSRLSEARRLHKAKALPAAGESIRQAIKRVATPAAPKAPAEAPAADKADPAGAWSIPDNASMDDIADALSIWVSKHGAAATGLAAKLADFMPVQVKRQRKVA